MTASDYTKLRRKRWMDAGLTARGFKRVNKSHPELKELKGRAYHLAYIQKQRRLDRESWK
jgi:hypothetical protein